MTRNTYTKELVKEFRKDFMKEKRASLTLSVNDIFKTRISGQFSESEQNPDKIGYFVYI